MPYFFFSFFIFINVKWTRNFFDIIVIDNDKKISLCSKLKSFVVRKKLFEK